MRHDDAIPEVPEFSHMTWLLQYGCRRFVAAHVKIGSSETPGLERTAEHAFVDRIPAPDVHDDTPPRQL